LIIDGEKDYLEGKNQNTLRAEDIEKIVKAFDDYKNIDKYCRVVDIKEIKENEFNLNVKRYIDSSEEEEEIDVGEVYKEIEELEKEKKEVDKKVKGYLEELYK